MMIIIIIIMWKRQVEWKYNIEILTARHTPTFALLYVYLWYFFVRKRRWVVWSDTFRPRKYIYHFHVEWLLYGTRELLADKRARILRLGRFQNWFYRHRITVRVDALFVFLWFKKNNHLNSKQNCSRHDVFINEIPILTRIPVWTYHFRLGN